MFKSEEKQIPHHLERTCSIPPDHIPQKMGRTTPANDRFSPIPKDPIYAEPADYRISTPKPRLKPEALDIARSHQGKDLAYLFNPGFKIIPIGMKLSHREPRDHEKENYRKIKEIQRANREKQGDSSRRTPVKAVYKPDKFEHVQSVVAQQIQTPLAPRNTPRSPILRRSKSSSDIDKSNSSSINMKNEQSSISKSPNNKQNEKNTKENGRTTSLKGNLIDLSSIDRSNRLGKRPSSARSSRLKENDHAVQKRPQRPSSACEVERKKKQPLSHITLNKQAVQKTKVRKNPTDAALEELHAKKEHDVKQHKRGNIPKYLRNRQTEWKKAEEERIANLPDPTVPQGHTVMPEVERLKTLSLLQTSKEDMLSELKTFPFSRDTMRIKCRKDVLERKLAEVDTALKIFSRPRVFIKDE